MVTAERMSRPPDERLYSSGSNDAFAFTQCYVSLGDTDGEDFAFTKCNPDGSFSLSGIPNGTWRVTVFDQWNDMMVDGLSTPVAVNGGADADMGQIAMNQWQAEHLHPHLLRSEWQRRLVTPTRPASRWCRPTSASATAATRTSTTPT